MLSSASHLKRTLKTAPSPPRCLPGPAESHRSSNASYSIGKSNSAVSAGMFMQLPRGSIVTFMPSLNGVPPQPPAGSSEKTSVAPCASLVAATSQLHSEQVDPVARSGIAFARACQIALVIFEDAIVVHPMVGAGHFAFSQQLSGTTILIGANMPEFDGACGARKNC